MSVNATDKIEIEVEIEIEKNGNVNRKITNNSGSTNNIYVEKEGKEEETLLS